MIPDLSRTENLRTGARSRSPSTGCSIRCCKLRLPLPTKAEDPDGLAFDFLSPTAGPQGRRAGYDRPRRRPHHASTSPKPTIPSASARRSQMGEPYRTLLGHFRHEIAHYYWDRLVAQTRRASRSSASCSATSGRITARRCSSTTPTARRADWQERFVIAYASAHPWEDFAETWAHYFHMVDTLETASAFGMQRAAQAWQGRRPFDRDRFRSARRRAWTASSTPGCR